VKVVQLVKKTFKVWSDAEAPTLGASLSYYTLFSIAPLFVIVLAVAGMIYGPTAARGQLAGEIGHTVGPQVAQSLEGMLQSADRPSASPFALIFGIVMLFLGASGVFNELQTALDAIWGVKPKEGRGILGILKDRFLSFTMVIGTCFLLLVSLLISTLLSALTKWWTPASMPGGTYLWQAINGLVSFGVVTAMFAIVYKVLPDVRLSWRNVWVGAGATAVMFVLGKYLLGLYLGRSSVAGAFGAAGSLAVLLVWVYYSAQIFLFGAAFTRVYAESRGEMPKPDVNAVADTNAVGATKQRHKRFGNPQPR